MVLNTRQYIQQFWKKILSIDLNWEEFISLSQESVSFSILFVLIALVKRSLIVSFQFFANPKRIDFSPFRVFTRGSLRVPLGLLCREVGLFIVL